MREWRFLILLLCAVVLAGCDRFSDIVVYNPTDQQLMLYRGAGGEGFPARPCSVLIEPGLSISLSGPTDIRVTDSSGAEVYAAALEPTLSPRRRLQIDVRIPEEIPGACPESPPDRFVIVVQNKTDQQMTIVVDEGELGSVEPHSTETFGPFDGELTFFPRTSVLAPSRREAYWYPVIDYLLTDELPEYQVIILRPEWK